MSELSGDVQAPHRSEIATENTEDRNQTQVETQLGIQRDLIEHTINIILRLEKQLDSVTRAEIDSPEKEVGVVAPTIVPLAEELRRNNGNLSAIRDTLVSLVDRLEL